jgi:ribose transport system substrate-binding protein
VLKLLRSGRVAAAVVALVAAALLAACGSSGSSSSTSDGGSRTTAKTGGVKIGFDSYADPSDGYTQAWKAGLECFADANGDSVTTVYSNVDLNKQITDVQTLLAQGMKGIFLYPLDTAALTPTFQKAKQQGVAVLSTNGPAPNAVNFDVNANRQALGGDTVRIAQSVVPSGGKAVIIGGPPQALAVQQQILGFTNAARAAGIQILGRIDNAGNSVTSQIQQGQIIGNELLAKYPDANIIYTLTPDQALGASIAAKAHGKVVGRGFAIVGSSIDPAAVRGILAGKITGLADDDTWMFGYNAAKAIDAYAHGTPVTAAPWHVTAYTKDNAADWVAPEQRCAKQGG